MHWNWPHGVLPTGRQSHPGNGKPPVEKHSSPTGHCPLHAGAVSPQGWAPEMQTQVIRSWVEHSEPGGQVPPHDVAGSPPEHDASGSSPPRLVFEQSARLPATASDAMNVPASSPLLNVLGATPGSHTVRYSDTSTPDSAAKPCGAAMMQLWVAIGTAATTDEDEAEFYGTVTKNPIPVGFTGADDEKVATYFARWANRKGDTGPWSLPVSMRIAA